MIRKEESKASALQKVRSAMDALEHLFDMAKDFYVAEPNRDASAAVCFMFGSHSQAFQDTVDENTLQNVLIQTADRNPRLMLNAQPNLSTIRDCPNLQQLMNMLVEESTRVHSILTTQEDKNQERLLKKRALQRDIEALKHKINDNPEQDLIVGVLNLDQLQELKKRRSQIQTMDSQELVMADI